MGYTRYGACRIRRARRERAAKMRRRRMTARAAVLFSAFIIAAAGVNLLTPAFARDTGAIHETIIVAYGDTLWDIAREYNTSNRDVRAVVDDIMRANNMKTTEIYAGDKIYIPIK